MRFTARSFIFSSGIFVVLALCIVIYKLHISQTTHGILLNKVKDELSIWQPNSVSLNEESQAKVVSTSTKKQLWSSIQSELKDTVVQVFAQVVEFNWIEPYKTPTQSEGAGTAFFINNKGDLITNAHVVDQAQAVTIQIPSLGKRRFEVDIIGISPERDLALLRLKEKELQSLKTALKKENLPFLKFGNSDTIHRADKLMALGYPLGQQGLKSTTGVVSGREHIQGQHFIQISAPLNKGNSGGPSLNHLGEVIGVNSGIIPGAQSIGYIIPSNEVLLFMRQLGDIDKSETPKLLRKPFLGILFNNATEDLTNYLGNPLPGGLYIVDVYKGGPLNKAGIKTGDMIYEINGHSVDMFGELNIGWNIEDKISIMDYVSRLKEGDNIHVVYYRYGKRKEVTLKFTQSELAPIRRVFPGYEKIDYEIIGGLVIMPLTLNHLMLLVQYAPELVQYADYKKQMSPILIVTHILLNSAAYRCRAIQNCALISEINGEKVKTLNELRTAILNGKDSGFLTIKTTESVFMALPLADILQDEERLSKTYFYPLSDIYKELARSYKKN